MGLARHLRSSIGPNLTQTFLTTLMFPLPAVCFSLSRAPGCHLPGSWEERFMLIRGVCAVQVGKSMCRRWQRSGLVSHSTTDRWIDRQTDERTVFFRLDGWMDTCKYIFCMIDSIQQMIVESFIMYSSSLYYLHTV